MQEKETRPVIRNEADNGLKNLEGTLSMARTQAVDSATSQFFINLRDNAFLDHGSRDFGYAVFGRVAEGMDVVRSIARVETCDLGFYQDVPKEPVLIEITLLKSSAGENPYACAVLVIVTRKP